MDESREWIFISSGQGHAKLPASAKKSGRPSEDRRSSSFFRLLLVDVRAALDFLPVLKGGDSLGHAIAWLEDGSH